MASTEEISVRGFRPTDSSSLGALVARSGAARWSAEQLQSSCGSAASRVRLAVASARPGADPVELPVGFVIARRVLDAIEIDLVGVDRAWRRRGVARRLLESLLAEERAAGAREARLELAEDNRAARALYAALGFMVVGRRPRYYPDGKHALLLTAHL